MGNEIERISKMKKSILAGLLSIFPGRGQTVSIPSYEIKQPKARMQLSKRATQKKKGKKVRKNRGRKRRKE